MLNRGERVPTSAYVRAAIVTVAVAVGALWLVTAMLRDGLFLLASTIGAVTVFLLIVYLRRTYSAMRWMAIGIALAVLFGVYPILFNVYLSFTNMSSGHLFSKAQSIERLESEQFLPEGAETFTWAGYRSPEGYAILLVDADPPRFVSDSGADETAELDAAGEPPAEIDEYQLLAPNELLPILDALADIDFGDPDSPVRIQSFRAAAVSQQRFEYDSEANAIVDLAEGVTYHAREGSWVGPDGEELVPGFIAFVGDDNFVRLINDEGLRTPLLRVLAWSFAFAFLSVALSFLVGLGVALLFEDLPGNRIIRALLIVPYPIPVLISVLIWRSMLNPELGTIGEVLTNIFGSSPQFFLDATWTRIALIVVNIWLSFPYFYIVTSGALRAIPGEYYDAAEVDGAGPWQRFRYITSPQLLVMVAPLLIASFAFNFNNFNLIYIFNFGDPPMAGTSVPIGHTDILISLVYNLAFVQSGVSNYGLGAAMAVVLFVVVGSITWFQIRSTRAWEER
jgi:arabinogalactan oligomer / maltooligosaccharide transport system permease protein